MAGTSPSTSPTKTRASSWRTKAESPAFQSTTRRGTNVVDSPVPTELEAGSYNVSIVTKPGNTYFTANIDSVVTVA
jgi:hypothetical protein